MPTHKRLEKYYSATYAEQDFPLEMAIRMDECNILRPLSLRVGLPRKCIVHPGFNQVPLEQCY